MTETIPEVEQKLRLAQSEFDDARNKIDALRDQIMGEIRQVFPASLDHEIEKVIGANSEIVNKMPESNLGALRSEIAASKDRVIIRVTRELEESKDWYFCREYSSYDMKGLDKIVKSIENDFLPIFQKSEISKTMPYSSGGVTDMYVSTLSFFKSPKIEQLLRDLKSAGSDFCYKQSSLGRTKSSLESAKAVGRFRG